MVGIGSIPIFAMVIIEPERVLQYLPKIFNFDFIYDLNQKKISVLWRHHFVRNFLLKKFNFSLYDLFSGQCIC